MSQRIFLSITILSLMTFDNKASEKQRQSTGGVEDSLFMRACRREAVARPPVLADEAGGSLSARISGNSQQSYIFGTL